MRCTEIETAPLTSGGSIPRDGREHWLASDTQLPLLAPRPFISHTLATAFAGGQNLGAGTFLTTNSRRLGEEIGAAMHS